MTIHKIDTITSTRECNHSGSSMIGATEYTQDWECYFQGPVPVTVWEDDTDRWEVWECPWCYHEHDDELAPVLLDAPDWPADEDPWNDRRGDR